MSNNIAISFIVIIFSWSTSLNAQQTVGVFQNSEASFNGYTLFSPDLDTYLIDNCGEVINKWSSEFKGSVSVYLLEDGDLLRTSRITNTSFNAGGYSGRIERFSWEGDLEWTFEYSNEQFQSHHDIEPLPNGNILVLAWEGRSSGEAIARGRANGTAMWPDRVIEIEPTDNNIGQIVWLWSAWDHLIQNVDPNLDNYGEIKDHPELLDINLIDSEGDWMHCNSVDYNIERDEIILSSRNFNEVLIIDHSTTTAEAASHEGGNSGKGGDILYRWGNPKNYGRGSTMDQKLFGNHDARWIEYGDDQGKVMVFNNAHSLSDNPYSTVDIINPPLSGDDYVIEEEEVFGPEELTWRYQGDPLTSFFTSKQSGGTRLPNGNTLITDSSSSRIFEVNLDGQVVWDYENPVANTGGPVTQGTVVNNSNIFRAVRYAPNFAGFDGKDLTPKGIIEIDDNPMPCEIYADPNASAELSEEEPLPTIIGNIVSSEIVLQVPFGKEYLVNISNNNGQSVFVGQTNSMHEVIEVASLPKGIFFLTFTHPTTHTRHTEKFIKL